MSRKACPTPDKIAHPTEAAAIKHAQGLRRHKHASVDLVPYECRCGHWHVGHSQQSLRDRIRRARVGAGSFGSRRRRHKR